MSQRHVSRGTSERPGREHLCPLSRRFWAHWIFVPLLLGTVSQGPSKEGGAAVHGPMDPKELEAFMDGAVQAQLKAYGIPGAAVAVVRDGRVLLAKGYGFADLEQRRPVTAGQTIFRIASVSKPVLWTAVMQLVEQGKLDLDADVNTYLQGFQIPATFPEPITLRHLLTHTTGFEAWEWPSHAREASEVASLKQLLIRDMPARVAAPGIISSYSNYGAMLAGHLVEQASGVA